MTLLLGAALTLTLQGHPVAILYAAIIASARIVTHR